MLQNSLIACMELTNIGHPEFLSGDHQSTGVGILVRIPLGIFRLVLVLQIQLYSPEATRLVHIHDLVYPNSFFQFSCLCEVLLTKNVSIFSLFDFRIKHYTHVIIYHMEMYRYTYKMKTLHTSLKKQGIN